MMLRPFRHQGLRYLAVAVFLLLTYQFYVLNGGHVAARIGPWNAPGTENTIHRADPVSNPAANPANPPNPPAAPSALPNPAPAATPSSTSSNSTAPFPRHIWYKLGPRGISPDNRKYTESCISRNPTWTPHFLTDAEADAWVTSTFNKSHPHLARIYLELPIPILKADLLRYLLLYQEGGLWLDLDVECTSGKGIEEWVPTEFRDVVPDMGKHKSKDKSSNTKGPSLLVGWEFDVGWGNNFIRQFTSWTILAKPRSPHMWAVVSDIVSAVQATTSQHKIPVSQITMNHIPDIVDYTGPRRLTTSVFRSLEDQRFRKIAQDQLYEIIEPKMVGDVVILPGYSFAMTANKYEGGQKVGEKLVEHHYAGSWKNGKGGEDKDGPEIVLKTVLEGV